jgi:CRP-like cAMP-binding protein
MDTHIIAAGERIFVAGEPSRAVYIIDHGKVLISLGEGAARIELAHLGPGELFGESGVLEARPRSATATALTDTTLLVTDAATFVQAFGLEGEPALALIKLLCRRLRTSNLRHAPPRESGTLLRLLPASETLTREFAMTPIDIAHLPFQVSNRFGGEVCAIAAPNCYAIAARSHPELSAPHFEILRRDGHYAIRDLGSRYGTIVNGQVLSRGSLTPVAALDTAKGAESMVIAGPADSPFRFRLTLLE